MAGKGKVGGRERTKDVSVHKCEICGKTDGVIRIKAYTAKGRNRMVWKCGRC